MQRLVLPLLLLLAGLLGIAPAGATPARPQDTAPPGEEATDQEPPLDEGPGPEDLIVREVEFQGLESYGEAGVLRALGIEIGKPMPVMRPGAQRVWQTYRLLVTGAEPERLEGGGIKLLISVKELPVDLDPRFVGNDEIELETLLEWALLFDREEIYIHEADGIRNRLLAGYRRHGFAFAEVDFVVGNDEEGNPNDVIFQIREGPKVRATKVLVRGNRNMPDTGWGFWRGGLRSLAKIKTKGRGIFRWWGTVYDREVLDADLLAMRQVYRDRGWLDAKVEIEDLEYNDARSRLKVHVVVDEGKLWHVGSVNIRAVDPEASSSEADVAEELLYPEAELRDLLDLRPGQPFERARRDHDETELTRYYGEKGHLSATKFVGEVSSGFRWLEPDLIYDVEKKEVAVTYRILQGTRRTVREILISGNEHTNDKVVRRNIGQLEGTEANIREIDRSLARIRGTGYFDDPQDPTHPPPRVVFHEVPGDPTKVDVEYIVEEGRVVDFSLSGGINSDRGPVGLISLNMRNFQAGDLPSGFWSSFGEIYRKEAWHGNGESFEATFSPGTQVNYWSLAYQHPDLFGTHFDRYSGRAELYSRDRRYLSHDEDRTRGTLTIARLFQQGDFSLRAGFKWMKIDLNHLDENDDLPYTLVDSAGETTFQGLTLDLRYSRLDNRMNPSDGFYAGWDNTIYGGPFGGDEDVWVSELVYDRFWLLGGETDDVRSSVYVGLGASVAQPYGNTDFVNYAERFFLGGSTTMRGFDFRGVGPNDGDYALGGETMLRVTGEYRYPLYTTPIPGTSRRQEIFRLSPFVEVGLLDPDAFHAQLDEVRSSAGLSFGLVQPIPLVFNFGFPLRKGEGDDIQVFSFRLSIR